MADAKGERERGAAAEGRRRRDLRVAVWIVFGALAVFAILSALMWVVGLGRLGLE